MSFRQTIAIVNRNHLIHNLRVLREASQGAFFCPMVKADAYGHGAITCARALEGEGASRIGVALIEEGIELREAGVRASEIFLFGPFHPRGAPPVIEFGLVPVLSRWDQIASLEGAAVAAGKTVKVHLKFNTGMNRLGFQVDEAERLKKAFEAQTTLRVEGVCTHLAIGEDAGSLTGMSSRQMAAFEQVRKVWTGSGISVHAYNSSAFLSRDARGAPAPPSRLGFRPGISLYGESPVETSSIDLKPVMTLKTEVVMLHNLKMGESVSYGARWMAQRESTVAVLAIGYADGFHRCFSNCGVMLYRGLRVPVVGTVCMDYTLVDLTDALKEGTAPHIGEEVVVFGEQRGQYLRASECAARIGTIAYELFTSVSRRVPRVDSPSH